jgi:predicted RNase H-like nuclease (RuvC/YqgF family)
MGKLLVFASIVISLATAGLGFMNKGKLTETKDSLSSTEATLASTKKLAEETGNQLKTAKQELTEANAAKDQALADASQAKTALDKANADLTAANTKATEATTKLAQIETDLQTAKTELESLKSASTGTTTASGPDPELTARLQEQEAIIAKLTSELESKTATVKVIEEKEQNRIKQQLKKGTEGRILAVNPAWNFVVLNLGDKQGISNNTELLVKRGNRFLGKVRITSVEPSTSIADIVANSMPQGVMITPGDNVIFQGNDE